MLLKTAWPISVLESVGQIGGSSYCSTGVAVDDYFVGEEASFGCETRRLHYVALDSQSKCFFRHCAKKSVHVSLTFLRV